jgi:hypothetical protein
LPVTLPRGASDQRKPAEAGDPGPPPPGGPIRGGVGGPIRGGIRGPLRGPIRGGLEGLRNRCRAVRRAGQNCTWDSAAGRVRGPKSASARPGPCTRPRSADALTRREYHPARNARRQARSSSPRRRRAETARRSTGGCGGSSLTPGRAGWSRGHGSGVPPSAQRHPPGEGAARRPADHPHPGGYSSAGLTPTSPFRKGWRFGRSAIRNVAETRVGHTGG